VAGHIANERSGKVKFKVEFTPEGDSNKHEVLSFSEDYHAGLRRADEVRHKIGLPNLDIERVVVYGYMPYKVVLTIALSEEQARKSGLFWHSEHAEVVVPHRGLNKFVVEEYEVKRDETTGEVTRLFLKISLDPNAVRVAWVAAGYPTKWNPDA